MSSDDYPTIERQILLLDLLNKRRKLSSEGSDNPLMIYLTPRKICPIMGLFFF